MKRLLFGEAILAALMDAATAAWTTATAITSGLVIDLQALGNPRSLKILSRFAAASGSATSWSGVWTIQHDTQVSMATATTLATLPTQNNAAPGTAAQFNQDVDLVGAKRYIRLVFTPTFTGTITAGPIFAAGAFGDCISQPVADAAGNVPVVTVP